VLPDHAPRRVSESNSQLFGKMAAERHFSGYECFEVVAVIIGGPAAPFGVGGRRGILRIARGGFGRLFGKDVVERGVQGLLDLTAAAEIAIDPVFTPLLEAVAGGADHFGGLSAGLFAIR